ncbi:hypothetical protein BU15DRAFT_52330 [Melanogaster broomeanus]|nr:hypothetical protein BU15DRAFT_52330 [Melanogaster broomeanus]
MGSNSSSRNNNSVAGPSRLLSRTSRSSRAPRISPADSPPVPAKKIPIYDDLDDDLALAERLQIEELENATRALTFAHQFQNDYDAEEQQLLRQHAKLIAHQQVTFQCGICLEELPEDDAATVDDCSHTMCRSCLRGFVCSKIQERRFPILCPLCTAIDGNPSPAEISRVLVEQIGITEKQHQIWNEMELAQFSVSIDCRECNRSTFVDRRDHEETTYIECPLPDCDHVWCKECQQTITIFFGGPEHSCDGSSELDHLMKENGWRYCPSCKIPIQKGTGCNHMTCISPGCNTHFCYECGDMILQSTVKHEIDIAVSAHYDKCQLFDETQDDD